MKKKIALLLCSTGNEAFAVGNVIIGAKKYLFQNLPHEDYDIIFYTDKLEKNDELALKKIFPRIIINIYISPFKEKVENSAMFSYYSLFAFARFEGFDMLNYYEKIFYIDTDIVIQKDISNLINEENEFCICYYGANVKIIDKLSHNASGIVIEEITNEGFNLNKNQVMSGVYIMSDRLKCYIKLKEWLYYIVNKYKINDEDALNLAIQKFNINVMELDKKYNCFPDGSDYSKEAYILHSIGPAKFWRGTYNRDWEENNKIWIEAGGNTTYEENAKKRKLVDKIVWLIPNYNLRNKLRGFLLQKIGLSGR